MQKKNVSFTNCNIVMHIFNEIESNLGKNQYFLLIISTSHSFMCYEICAIIYALFCIKKLMLKFSIEIQLKMNNI